MFEKTLPDLVKGIRASKRDTALYISQCMAEIKKELESSDMFVKANALNKLTFLQMMGYSMSFASFRIIEVMSSPRFAHKRIGYTAACQGFNQDTDVILLATNMLQKELRGANRGGMKGVYEAGLAVNCISNIVTEDLARDVLPELTTLTAHPQPYLRKKALLCLFKVFVKYPQGLRLTFDQIQKCLKDPNPSVVSCAVNVITELSDKNPRNYLGLAPEFFKLLTSSSNNWMLIKVVKLLGSLVPEEPRLARKLLEPLADIVRSTQAKSLLYEAVHTITLCLPYCRKSDGTMPQIVPDIVTLCARTLRDFVEQVDQNLKYLGLVGFGSLMQSHPKVLSAPDYRPLILACLSDQDVTIRTRALDLLSGMVSRKNLMELVSQLLKHVELATGQYKLDLVAKIVELCSGEKYALLQDFAWYLDILFQLGHTRGIESHGNLLRAQVSDVALRVFPVRPYAVRRSMEILLEGEASASDDDPYGDSGRGKHIMIQILPAIAWIIGEYSPLIREAVSLDPDEDEDAEFSFDEKSKGTYHTIVQSLLSSSNLQKLPTSTQKVYIQAAMKVFAAASADMNVSNSELEACVNTIHKSLPVYTQSTDVEVVERSFTSMELLKSLNLHIEGFGAMPSLATVDGDSSADQQGDLLGMDAEDGVFFSKTQGTAVPSAGPKALGQNIRNASEILNYLLKPAPMKPVGAKAQQKKRQSRIGVSIDLDASVDFSVFQELIEEEEADQVALKDRMETVSFTQQQPLLVEESKPTPRIDTTGIGPLTSAASFPPTSFQKSENAGLGAAPRQLQRHGDPFYLDSAPASSTDDEHPSPKGFGTIQLLDSDVEEEDVSRRKQKKKKKKRAKRPKKESAQTEMAENWLSSRAMVSSGSPALDVHVYGSNDEDEDSERPIARKKAPNKEFEGLAKVDLTTPLREDEVMPERKHRDVPTLTSKEKKRSKRSKKSKMKSATKEDSAITGDLLDLGDGFGMASPTVTPTATPEAPPGSINPINAAFDDLLGLSAPAPAPKLEGTDTKSKPAIPASYFGAPAAETEQTSTKAKSLWLRATLKTSSSSPSSVDWSLVSVVFRVYRATKAETPAAKLVVRVDNNSSTLLNDLTLELSSISVSLGSIGPGSSTKSEKIGSFPYCAIDSAQEVKGSLKANNSGASVKLYLPATLHLSPEKNLSLELVAQELASSSQWSSHSVKINLGSAKAPGNVKALLGSFVRAAEVRGSSDSVSVMFAARSVGGARVRMLVKVKENDVEVDIKCTNASLGKSLASDIKRLVFFS